MPRSGEADRSLVRHARRDATVAGLGTGLVVLIAGLTTVAVLAAAVSAHADGRLDRVLVAAVALLALASFEAVAPLPGAAQELGATLASGRRVLELIDRPVLIVDPGSPAPPPSAPATVALEAVTARYAPGGPAVLDGLDLRIEPGRRLALVGESGAGKTTVTRLLFRFLDPEAGRVTIGGRDVREMRQEDVRRTFALAGQEAHVFNSTIRENLLLARPGGDDAELFDVLRRARLDDWVASLPLGLDTLVGEQGARLSGGQRQRLVLARALLVDAPVLVLDEPTAHLDPENAQALMRDVFETAGERSVLLITHRSEGLDLVDEIVELEAGRATRHGSRMFTHLGELSTGLYRVRDDSWPHGRQEEQGAPLDDRCGGIGRCARRGDRDVFWCANRGDRVHEEVRGVHLRRRRGEPDARGRPREDHPEADGEGRLGACRRLDRRRRTR